ncbi:MAG TPA: nitroreductase [Atribacteraceae bacterium]|nr:nitroreductase [Atribacteraceae bacterium]
MELTEAIRTRRSIRKYRKEPLTESTIRELLELATWAPSGMHLQPWAFTVIEDQDYLQDFSDRCKDYVLKNLMQAPELARYREMLADPTYHLFYQAPVLIMIYGDQKAFSAAYDCSMAAQNLMFGAWDRGIGSCWIGFAHEYGNTPEVKAELKVPGGYDLIAPIILGYPAAPGEERPRKQPVVLYWKR